MACLHAVRSAVEKKIAGLNGLRKEGVNATFDLQPKTTVSTIPATLKQMIKLHICPFLQICDFPLF